MIEIQKITQTTEYIQDVKAVIFDLDDTLYSEKQYVRSGYHAVANAFPCIEGFAQKLWKAFERGENAFDSVLTAEGIYTEQRKQTCLEVYRKHTPKLQMYEGVKEMLIALRTEGYKLGIITDGRPEGQWAKIEALDIRTSVDEIIVTDELGGIEYRKPNPKAFEIMQQRLQVPFSEMCYIGDNIRKDFIAPKQLGMRTLYFRNRDGLYQP